MKTVEIENRVEVMSDYLGDLVTVDLIIDGEKITTGDEPISSYSFWSDMLDQTRRALYRLKKNNPRLSFNSNLSTIGLSESDKNNRFIKYLKGKYVDLDVDKISELIDNEFKEIKPTGPDDNHPNPETSFPLNGDFNKHFIMSIISKLNK
jgi:hypothetical protein